MARRVYCIPCGRERRDVEAVAVVDGDPMCEAHAGLAAKGIELMTAVTRPAIMGAVAAKCKHPECKRLLQSNNRSGVCYDHRVWGHRNPEGRAQLKDGAKCRHPECEKQLRGVVRLRSRVCVEHYTWGRKHPLNPRGARIPGMGRAA